MPSVAAVAGPRSRPGLGGSRRILRPAGEDPVCRAYLWDRVREACSHWLDNGGWFQGLRWGMKSYPFFNQKSRREAPYTYPNNLTIFCTHVKWWQPSITRTSHRAKIATSLEEDAPAESFAGRQGGTGPLLFWDDEVLSPLRLHCCWTHDAQLPSAPLRTYSFTWAGGRAAEMWTATGVVGAMRCWGMKGSFLLTRNEGPSSRHTSLRPVLTESCLRPSKSYTWNL